MASVWGLVLGRQKYEKNNKKYISLNLFCFSLKYATKFNVITPRPPHREAASVNEKLKMERLYYHHIVGLHNMTNIFNFHLPELLAAQLGLFLADEQSQRGDVVLHARLLRS